MKESDTKSQIKNDNKKSNVIKQIRLADFKCRETRVKANHHEKKGK